MSEERLTDLETLYDKFYCDYCESHTEMLEALAEIRRLRAENERLKEEIVERNKEYHDALGSVRERLKKDLHERWFPLLVEAAKVDDQVTLGSYGEFAEAIARCQEIRERDS